MGLLNYFTDLGFYPESGNPPPGNDDFEENFPARYINPPTAGFVGGSQPLGFQSLVDEAQAQPHENKTPGGSGPGGNGPKRFWWTIFVFVLLALGIYVKQNMVLLPTVTFNGDHMDWHVALGAVFVALALFPFFMRTFNKLFPNPSLWHALFAFSIGFFSDLSSEGIKTLVKSFG